MTLGNDPQPLTRRQARELAQGHEPASAEHQHSSTHIPTHSSGSTPTQATPPAVKPAADKTAAEKTAAVKPPAVKPAAVTPDVAAPEKPAAASVFAPTSTKPAWAAAVSAPRRPVPERTLTRRELRALQLAEGHDGETGHEEPDHDQRGHDQLGRDQLGRDQLVADQQPLAMAQPPVLKASQPVPVEFLVEAKSPLSSTRARPGVLHPPVGHWSLDRDEDEKSIPGQFRVEPFDQIVSRGIGAGGIPTTTNALILPSIPHQGTTSGPLTNTGEIMITGSIDLPRSLGSTGAHPNLIDSAEMDRMLDQLDESGHHSGVTPVSASRAVSTHASTRGVMAPPPRRGVTMPTVLTIIVGALALGVVGLFVAGYVFKIF